MSNLLQALSEVLIGRNNRKPALPGEDEGDERRQRAMSVQSGAARAAVLGINDGLVTNISLILGVVGATASADVVQLAGLASLVAGAGSMAVGEYVSMRAQVELLERLLTEEREAIRADPERERAILQATLRRHGFDQVTSSAATKDLFRDPERALTVYSRAVLGVNPDELGSPWTSAVSSLLTFAFGALVPLVPWFITTSTRSRGQLACIGRWGSASDRRTARQAHRRQLAEIRSPTAPGRWSGFGYHVPDRQAVRHDGFLMGCRYSLLSGRSPQSSCDVSRVHRHLVGSVTRSSHCAISPLPRIVAHPVHEIRRSRRSECGRNDVAGDGRVRTSGGSPWLTRL